MQLPAGLRQKDFEDALTELREVAGDDWVFTEERHVQAYRNDFSLYRGGDKEPLPCGAVAPRTTEEVQQIVLIANTYQLPLWVISSGKDFGYGGSEAVVPGSLILDLKRMNRIIEVNQELAYAIVEPGVSQYDLWRHMQAEGIELWIDGPSPAWSSLAENTLERDIGYGLNGHRKDQVCGMEIVLPNGELLRSGMAAMDDPTGWAIYKAGVGPSVDGMFSQTNFGIVTRLGVWLVPQPRAMRSASILVPGYENIVPALDTITALRLQGIVNSAANGGLVKPALLPVGEMLSMEGSERAWAFRVAYYGSENMVNAAWDETRARMTEAVPDAKYFSDLFTAPYDAEAMDSRAKLAAGIPSFAEYEKWSFATTYFSVAVPGGGQNYRDFIRVFDDVYQRHGRRFYGGDFHLHAPRATVAVQGIDITVNDAQANEAVLALVTDLIDTAGDHGWGVCRTSPPFMEAAMQQYGFNNEILRRFNQEIKDVLDPNGILAPGKNGIWPQRFRRGRS